MLRKFFVGRAIVFLAILLILGGWWLLMYVLHQRQAAELFSYGYRCADGTEFTIIPSEDMETFHIVPTTSVEHIKDSYIKLVPSRSGARYEGNGVVFFGHGETVDLSADGVATKCSPMQKPDEAPMNFGD